ncbi:hypothetical protein OROGR_004054 [Orobanche gracilis]
MKEYSNCREHNNISDEKVCQSAYIYFWGRVSLKPNEDDVARLLVEAERRGTPGMLGSIDCMHWEWKNCPTQWSGMYTGKCGKPTIILEAIASSDIWIWHAFFGLSGADNDKNVLDRSPLLNEIVEGQAAPVKFCINGHNYDMGYYLADGIYPEWATFVKTIPAPQGVKRQHFAKVHEALRKDVERAFGILQSRFDIISQNERHLYLNAADFEYDEDPNGPSRVKVSMEKTSEVRDFIKCHKEIRDKTVHTQLQQDLIEHLWNIYSES